EPDYPADRARGAAAIYGWLVRAWQFEDRELAPKIWADFTALPNSGDVLARFALPRGAYEWELARMRGERIAPLPVVHGDFAVGAFERFTVGCDALDRRDFGAASRSLLDAERTFDWPNWQAFVR